MRVLVGHRVGDPEGEQFLVEIHDDGSATVATRPSPDTRVTWSPPVRLIEAGRP